MIGNRNLYFTVLTQILLLVIVMFVLVGCGMDSRQTEEMLQVENTPLPVVELPETSTAPQQTEKAEKKEKKEGKKFDPLEITKGDLESNFDEALKHVTICGKKVSCPITLKKLGKDFSFKKGLYQPRDTDNVVGKLCYKGEEIADAWISDGQNDGNIKKKNIYFLFFLKLSSSVDYEVDICGVGFDSSKEVIFEIFGEPENKEKIIYYKDSDMKSDCSVSFDFFVEGCPKGISIIYDSK